MNQMDSSKIPSELELLVSAQCSSSCAAESGQCTCKCRSRMVRLPPPPTPYRDCRMAKGDSMWANPSPTDMGMLSVRDRRPVVMPPHMSTEGDNYDELFLLEHIEQSPYPSATGSQVSLPLFPYTRPSTNNTCALDLNEQCTDHSHSTGTDDRSCCPQVFVAPTQHNLKPTTLITAPGTCKLIYELCIRACILLLHSIESVLCILTVYYIIYSMSLIGLTELPQVDSKTGEDVNMVKTASSSELQVLLSPKRFFRELLSCCPASEDQETLDQRKQELLDRQRKGKGPLIPKKATVSPNLSGNTSCHGSPKNKQNLNAKFLAAINNGSQRRHSRKL